MLLSTFHQVLTFIIDISNIQNELNHRCSLRPASILRENMWKVVMKCKIVVF